MGRGPHLYRRGAVYYWQRRLPTQLARCLRISHVKLNLKTKDVAIARRLVAPLDACVMEIFMGDAEQLTREQMGNIFKSVLVEHQAKLAMLADAERAQPTTDRSRLLEDELAQGIAYTLLSEQGTDAQLEAARQETLMKEGHSLEFLVKIIEHLERLRDEKGIKISQRRLSSHVERAGGTINAINLTRAQPIYLRALGSALLAAKDRYGSEPIPELDFTALMEEAAGSTPEPLGRVAISEPSPMAPPPSISVQAGTGEDGERSRADGGIEGLAKKLGEKRTQDNEWDSKTARQARFIFALFARFMREQHRIDGLCLVRQIHIADFDSFLRSLHANFGKSPRDAGRSIAEIRVLALKEMPLHGALQGATRNRHLTFLGQLFAYGRGCGLAIDPSLSPTPFRARKNKRGRDQRPVPAEEDVVRLFQRPIFVGYAHWDNIDAPGQAFFHRAEYYCSILACYAGARREEYCGLAVDDVIRDNGEIPYLHIAPNSIRRIKNTQSVRNLALHPEIVRLGFLDYVEVIRALGYERLFPDLYSPSTRSPMGDRLYDQMLPSLKAAGFTPHQMRHFFGDELKQGEVSKEFRADLLGHGGESETTERYCNPLKIKLQMVYLLKLPVMTGHLERRPINILPWVMAKEIAPWSRAGKAAARQSKALDRTIRQRT